MRELSQMTVGLLLTIASLRDIHAQTCLIQGTAVPCSDDRVIISAQQTNIEWKDVRPENVEAYTIFPHDADGDLATHIKSSWIFPVTSETVKVTGYQATLYHLNIGNPEELETRQIIFLTYPNITHSLNTPNYSNFRSSVTRSVHKREIHHGIQTVKITTEFETLIIGSSYQVKISLLPLGIDGTSTVIIENPQIENLLTGRCRPGSPAARLNGKYQPTFSSITVLPSNGAVDVSFNVAPQDFCLPHWLLQVHNPEFPEEEPLAEVRMDTTPNVDVAHHVFTDLPREQKLILSLSPVTITNGRGRCQCTGCRCLYTNTKEFIIPRLNEDQILHSLRYASGGYATLRRSETKEKHSVSFEGILCGVGICLLLLSLYACVHYIKIGRKVKKGFFNKLRFVYNSSNDDPPKKRIPFSFTNFTSDEGILTVWVIGMEEEMERTFVVFLRRSFVNTNIRFMFAPEDLPINGNRHSWITKMNREANMIFLFHSQLAEAIFNNVDGNTTNFQDLLFTEQMKAIDPTDIRLVHITSNDSSPNIVYGVQQRFHFPRHSSLITKCVSVLGPQELVPSIDLPVNDSHMETTAERGLSESSTIRRKECLIIVPPSIPHNRKESVYSNYSSGISSTSMYSQTENERLCGEKERIDIFESGYIEAY